MRHWPFELALERRAFGSRVADFANVQDWITLSRVQIDEARLLVLHAAWRIDREGNAAAHGAVAAIKLAAARTFHGGSWSSPSRPRKASTS